jgi:hypothetical protein
MEREKEREENNIKRLVSCSLAERWNAASLKIKGSLMKPTTKCERTKLLEIWKIKKTMTSQRSKTTHTSTRTLHLE